MYFTAISRPSCLTSQASADNLPGGFLNALTSTSFSEVPSDLQPVCFLTVAASVASAAFTAAVRNSELSVALEASASGVSVAFSAAVQASTLTVEENRVLLLFF